MNARCKVGPFGVWAMANYDYGGVTHMACYSLIADPLIP